MNDPYAVESAAASAGTAPAALMCLVLAVAGAVLALAGGLAIDPLRATFPESTPELDKEFAEMTTANPPPELTRRMTAFSQSSERRNAALVFAVVGAIAAGGCSLVVNGVQRTGVNILVCPLVFAAVGGALGAVGGFASASVEQRVHVSALDEMLRGGLIHATAWGFVGLAVGAACRGMPGAFVGMLAAVIGVVVASMLAMVLFPESQADLAMPIGKWHFVLWNVVILTIVGLAVGRIKRPAGQPVPALGEAGPA